MQQQKRNPLRRWLFSPALIMAVLIWIGTHTGPHDVHPTPAPISQVPADSCSGDGRIVSAKLVSTYPQFRVLCSDGISILTDGR